MNQALSLLALMSVWNLLILLAVWRVSVRMVEEVKREARSQKTVRRTTKPVTPAPTTSLKPPSTPRKRVTPKGATK